MSAKRALIVDDSRSARAFLTRILERYDLQGADDPDRPSYAQLASERGLPVSQVTNHLHWARREFRAAVLLTLREITASEAEFRAEARALLGVDPP